MRVTSLCNLGSINLDAYVKSQDKAKLAKTIVKMLDSTVVNNHHQLESAKPTTKYAFIGVGVCNLAYVLAQQGLPMDSQQASEYIDALFDDLSYNIISASNELAKKYGPFENWENTKWFNSLPILESRKHFPSVWNLTEYGRNFNLDRWMDLQEQIKKYGIRNATLMAIAPTSRSSKVINNTPSIEPVLNTKVIEENTTSVISTVPGFGEVEYSLAFDCDQKMLIQNTAIMQKYVDQAISHTIFLNTNSMRKIHELHKFGFDNGVKTFYYLKQRKQDYDECGSCVV